MVNLRGFVFLCALGLSWMLAAQTAPPSPKPVYLDPGAPLEQRVDDLVARMTLEEKAAQMQDVAPAIPRLGVPAYNWWNEGLHGVAWAGHATVFPQAIALAATWNTELMHRVADVISTEARAKYNDALQHDNYGRFYGLTFWSPNINIFRDPRWGRGQETYGEDPFLTGRMAVAFVTGLQGDNPKYLKTISTPKHYGVHSGPEVLRHRFDVPVSEHDFTDTYTPAFRAAIVEGKAGSVMCSYNAVWGQPACASAKLYDTLRSKWKFSGYTVSDCGAISDIYQGHGYVLTLEQSAAIAVKAGTDLSCGREYRVVPFAVQNRSLAPEELDQAVRRLFAARFRLGMFDPPELVPWSKLTLADNDTEEHRQLARQAAREAVVLLKNDRGVLPLKPGRKTIAVIGPNADALSVLLGNYNGMPSRYTTILEGIRRQFQNVRVLYAQGSLLTETSAVPVPASVLRTGGTNSRPGLKAEYFNNLNLQGASAAERIDPEINFTWNAQPPAPGVSGTSFSARWTGELIPPVTGDYRLGGATDDGFRLYLDGKLLADDWTTHGERTITTNVRLEAGHAYKITMEYFQGEWDSVARLVWEPPNLAAEAVTAARQADVVIAVVGITPQLEGEERDTSSPGFFGGDRVDLDLPRPQQQLLEAVATTGKPLVVILTSGSALAVNWAQQHAAAILQAWYPGEEGGTAVADVLSGNYNPAGRLPVTFYTSVAQLPPFEVYSMSNRTYRYFPGTPLYPFGYGLSYTTFAYSNARADRQEMTAGGAVTVSVEVKNTGTMAGDEVVQVYVSQPQVAGAAIRALAGFQRVHLNPGETKPVAIRLRDRELSTVDDSGRRRLVPGTVDLWIGGGQPLAAAAPGASGARLNVRIVSAAVLPD